MDILHDIEQLGSDFAYNLQKITVGTEKVEEYRAQIEALTQLDREMRQNVDAVWDEGFSVVSVFLELGKDQWHGQQRTDTNEIMDVDLMLAGKSYYDNYIITNWMAIKNRIDALQALINEEEGIISKLTSQNEEIKNRQTELEKKKESLPK